VRLRGLVPRFTCAVPVFVSFTFCEGAATPGVVVKVTAEGDSVITPTPPDVASPASETVSGELGLLRSWME